MSRYAWRSKGRLSLLHDDEAKGGCNGVSWKIEGKARFQVTRGNIRKHATWAAQ